RDGRCLGGAGPGRCATGDRCFFGVCNHDRGVRGAEGCRLYGVYAVAGAGGGLKSTIALRLPWGWPKAAYPQETGFALVRFMPRRRRWEGLLTQPGRVRGLWG